MQGLKAVSVFSGHNADDIAETVLLNLVRGDLPRLGRCAGITTGEESALPRVKPFKFAYEKDIVMYAYFKKLDYFSTECIYAPYATRGFAREFIKDLEVVRPRAISDLVHAAEGFRVAPGSQESMPAPQTCERCHYMSSQAVCKACLLLEGLNQGRPSLGIAKKRSSPAPIELVASSHLTQTTLHGKNGKQTQESLGSLHGVHHAAALPAHPSARTPLQSEEPASRLL